MRIWHVGVDPDPFRVNGVTRTVWLLSLEQARLGHDVSLIVEEAPTPDNLANAQSEGLQMHDVTTGPLSYSKHLRQMLESCPPQVVHMHSVFIPSQAVMAKLLRQYDIPYIITPHAGLAPQVLARGRLKKTIYSAVRERPRFMHAAAVALVTPAEERAVRSFIPSYGGIVRWMPNPVDFGMLDPVRWHGLAQRKRLVFLGRFDVLVKGIDILIEIARLLPEVQVDLYGTEDPKTLDWFNKLKEDLPPNVSFHDPIFGKDKAEILAGASVYIQPSRWEGFPVSVAECLYLGVPSAITESLDLAQLFRQHDLGLVLSLEPRIAAEQLRAALSDEPQMQQWSKLGREFALKYFVPSASAQRYIDLYGEVASTATSAAAGSSRDGKWNGHRTAGNGNGQAGAAVSLRARLMPAGMRNAVKENVSRLVERSNEVIGKPATPRSIVLCYHSISEQEHGLTVSPDVFREQIATLREMGYAFQTFADHIDYIMRWGLPDSDVAVITFDDGYEDNFYLAAPILADLKVPATFFITSGLLERDTAVVERFTALTGLGPSFITADQLRQMHRAGMEIGTHTHSHANLARLPALEARREVTLSKNVIEQALGSAVRSFAYPFGKRHIHYTRETVDLVREAGYRGAASVAFRAVSARSAVRIFEVPRFFITRGDSGLQFRQKVIGHFDWVGHVQEISPGWFKSLISPEDRY